MTFQVDGRATAGLQEGCPACGAEPGESCVNRFGGTRRTTHQERKPKVDQT